MRKSLRRLAFIKAFYPYFIFAFVLLAFVVMVIKKDQHVYTNKKYQYSVHLPKGWAKDYIQPMAISYHSKDLVPGSREPEATITITVQERYPDLDLATHFNMVIRDLSHEERRIINKGAGYVGREDARWVEFQDVNGIENHVWYIFFNRTNHLMIIQNRVSNRYVDKYRDVFKGMLDSFKTTL